MFLKVGPNCQLNLHKNLDFWHFSWKTKRPGNMKWYSCPAVIGRMRRAPFKWATCSLIPSSPYFLPDLAHSTSSHLPGLWALTQVHLSKSLSPLHSGRHHGGGGFRTGSWKTDTTVVKFYFTKECLNDFYTLFLRLPVLVVSFQCCSSTCQQHSALFAICVLESRHLKFPFNLCHLPDERI